MKAKIIGQYQYPGMEEPKRFEHEAEFTLYPPVDGEYYYGTGCYMGVDFANGNHEYIDVRYAGTKEMKVLAERFIKDYFGENLIEYHFI